MTKQFKEIIAPNAVLLIFYSGLKLIDKPIAEMRELAAYFGSDVDIIKIEKLENEELCRLLKITEDVTYMLYSQGELIERMNGYTPELMLKSAVLSLLNSLKVS